MTEQEDTVENRQAIIKDMTDQLEREAVDKAEIADFKDFASKQPYAVLRRDSLTFWRMRL